MGATNAERSGARPAPRARRSNPLQVLAARARAVVSRRGLLRTGSDGEEALFRERRKKGLDEFSLVILAANEDSPSRAARSSARLREKRPIRLRAPRSAAPGGAAWSKTCGGRRRGKAKKEEGGDLFAKRAEQKEGLMNRGPWRLVWGSAKGKAYKKRWRSCVCFGV
jgi:hypothetical protein